MYQKYNEPTFPTPKEVTIDYQNFRGGLNLLYRQTELRPAELAQADNLYLIGLGIPTKRWGSQNYYAAGATGYGRGLLSVKSSSGTKELLGMTDWGILTKQAGASYAPITGASWASGYPIEGTQLNNKVYLVNGQRELVRYDFSTLVSFVTIGTPLGLSATNLSAATGSQTQSWRVTAVSQVGETLGSVAVSLPTLPQNLADTTVRLQWTPVSAASGVLTGYNIYRGSPGDETFIGGVDNLTTIFDDYGATASLLHQPPVADTTGGPIAKWIIRFQDRLILAGINGEPTKVLISGRVPQHERFDALGGGGYVYVDRDTGDNLTGLAVHQGRIIAFKERSVWDVRPSTTTYGNFLLLEPTFQLITASQGCSSHRSIAAVDNDLLFASDKGVYVLGYEPNITGDVLRTNELSAKIRPFFQTLSQDDLANATAIYFDYKYILAFPSAKKCIIFDKERAAWMGPWTTTFGINKFVRHIDDSGVERLLCIDADDTYVTEFSKALTDDKGVAFGTVLRTKKDDMGQVSLFKTLSETYTNFRNVTGTINVNVYTEDRDGNFSATTAFNVNGPSSQITAMWGSDLWGSTPWGISNTNASSSSEDIIKRKYMYDTTRYVQYEVITTGREDNYELLNIQTKGFMQGTNNPYQWDA